MLFKKENTRKNGWLAAALLSVCKYNLTAFYASTMSPLNFPVVTPNNENFRPAGTMEFVNIFSNAYALTLW